MTERDYSQGKQCSICGVRITNRASFCRHHYYGGLVSEDDRRKRRKRHYSSGNKCCDCGRLITNVATRCDRCSGIAKKTVFVKYHYSKRKQCIDCGKPISNKAKRCRSCSKKGVCRPDMQGKNNWKWNGGWNPYYGPNWWSQRKKALKRDAYRCYLCGSNKEQLNVHHQIPFSKCDNYKEANSLDNLITLCQKCHILAEKQEFDSFMVEH